MLQNLLKSTDLCYTGIIDIAHYITNDFIDDYRSKAVFDINENLPFHLAWHTFATTVTLTNVVFIESVSKMLGHKSLKTTQHYAKILDRKVSDDMKKIRKLFN